MILLILIATSNGHPFSLLRTRHDQIRFIGIHEKIDSLTEKSFIPLNDGLSHSEGPGKVC